MNHQSSLRRRISPKPSRRKPVPERSPTTSPSYRKTNRSIRISPLLIRQSSSRWTWSCWSCSKRKINCAQTLMKLRSAGRGRKRNIKASWTRSNARLQQKWGKLMREIASLSSKTDIRWTLSRQESMKFRTQWYWHNNYWTKLPLYFSSTS